MLLNAAGYVSGLRAVRRRMIDSRRARRELRRERVHPRFGAPSARHVRGRGKAAAIALGLPRPCRARAGSPRGILRRRRKADAGTRALRSRSARVGSLP